MKTQSEETGVAVANASALWLGVTSTVCTESGLRGLALVVDAGGALCGCRRQRGPARGLISLGVVTCCRFMANHGGAGLMVRGGK